MIFSSIIFLLYFIPFFFLFYFLSKDKFKNHIIFAFSVFFYAWGAPKFVFVLLLVTFLDYHFVKRMDASKSNLSRKLWLSASLIMNVGLLFYFKYCNFFIENINEILIRLDIKPIKALDVVMPIGISFYTFETITYVVDVYRKLHKPLNNYWDYQLYILLFPKLIAGPIVKFHDIADQIYGRFRYLTSDFILQGFYRFCIGLSKKVIIANNVGIVADTVFNGSITDFSSSSIWLAALSYTLQIYFDFSGYSDMAIGLCKMMGFKILENFDNPYTSTSINEFWKKWHISLGNWMREYLYIPLGGNRVSPPRMYFNLWTVFLLSGFWHGASWNFILWGIYHGAFMILERLFLLKVYKKIKILAVPFNFIIVMIGWIMFRLDDLSKIKLVYSKMFFINLNVNDSLSIDEEQKYIILIGLFFSFCTLIPFIKNIEQKVFYSNYTAKLHLVMFSISLILLIISISYITAFNFNPFIYFRF